MKVYCIAGPTASGKNDFALRLLTDYPNIHIINVDSAQIYRELSIGANKPSLSEQESCPHHLYSYKSVTDHYDVSVFITDLFSTLEKVNAAGGIPVLVGGTMMYFNQLKDGLVVLPQLPHDQVSKWRLEHESVATQLLYDRLASVDPLLADRISSADRQRIERGLIVFELTQTPLSEYQTQTTQSRSDISWHFLKLNYEDKDRHRAIIKSRLDKMLKMGFVEEVVQLYKDYPKSTYAFWRYVGYRQLREYLQGDISLERASEKVYFATCQLAKRQKTWLKKFTGQEFYVDQQSSYEKFSRTFSCL